MICRRGRHRSVALQPTSILRFFVALVRAGFLGKHLLRELFGVQQVDGPLKGPSNDASQKARFSTIKTSSPEKLQTLSVLSQSSRLVSLQKKTIESPATSPVQPQRCNGKGREVHSVLRSGVGQRSFVHTVSSLGALPFLETWDENKEQADDAHDTTPDTLVWTVSSNAYGGRALELQTIDFAGASFSR